ncbi:hypothetical protein OIU78_026952 [Salix suchowensis]|nr:hypothetical protein OIU78_026952 [Salix suchowensis]
MEKEFVWITTVDTMNLIDTFDASIISSMQGVTGVKSYYSRSTIRFKNFRYRFNEIDILALEPPADPQEDGHYQRRKSHLRLEYTVSNSHKEFVEVVYDQLGRGVVVKGFSINVFDATLKFLPYYLPHIFVPFNGTYDSLVEQVKLQNYDAVVANTAIVANRFQSGDFSQPYADSGLQMLIFVRTKNINRAWLFTKPFSASMWISIGAINIYNGFVVWLIERNDERNRDAEIRRGSLLKQIGYMLYSAFKTLFSLNVDKLSSNLSRFVMVVWLFLALVLTQSFTASLSAIFFDQRNHSATVDVETLRNTGAKIGCDGGSFVAAYLRDVLNIHPDNIVKIYSGDAYAKALVSGEIAAAYLEVPYLKVFLAKYCEGFTTSGPIYKVGGYGFFTVSSGHFEAIVRVVESGTLKDLENSLTSSYKCVAADSSDERTGLDVSSFPRDSLGFPLEYPHLLFSLFYIFLPPRANSKRPVRSGGDEDRRSTRTTSDEDRNHPGQGPRQTRTTGGRTRNHQSTRTGTSEHTNHPKHENRNHQTRGPSNHRRRGTGTTAHEPPKAIELVARGLAKAHEQPKALEPEPPKTRTSSRR